MKPTGQEIFATIKERKAIYLLLFVGLINGLSFLFLIPPWQHYDEPGQFEYTWLIANQRGIQQIGRYDQGMRREVAASMIEHEFFREMDWRPNLLSTAEPIWIGISQTNDPPLYYWIISLPLRLVPFTDITFQLLLGRLVSLSLYLVTILAAYGIIVELTPPGHFLRMVFPLSIIFLPTFTDLMTAVNNDVGATAFFSLFLLVSIRLMRSGFTWPRLLAATGLAAACYWTKNTVAFAVLLLPFPILFSLAKAPHKRWAWLLVGVAGIIAFFTLLDWPDLAYWYRMTPEKTPLQATTRSSTLGIHALQLSLNSPDQPPSIFQIIPPDWFDRIKHDEITLGAWVWADKPARIRTPILKLDDNSVYDWIDVNTQPAFYSLNIPFSGEVQRMQVILAPVDAASQEGLNVFYDGLVLTSGSYPSGTTPQFFSRQAEDGFWEEAYFTNLIRNGSGEKKWVRIRPGIETLINRFFPDNPSLILSSLIDWPGAGWYYRTTLKQLFITYWGKFGWAHVPLKGFHPYRIAGLFTVLAFGGFFYWGLTARKNWSPELVFFLGMAILGLWGAALVRGISSISGTVFIPSARYAFPAIIPTVLILSVGWFGFFKVFNNLQRKITIPYGLQLSLYVLFLFWLNLSALLSISSFYAGT